jgi:hypothetical protein
LAGYVAFMGKKRHAYREWDHLEDPVVDGRIMLKCVLEKWDEGMDWINLAQNRDRCRSVVNATINL